MDFDSLLEEIGPFDRYQWIFFVVLGISAAVPAGVQVLLGVYLYATPAHWCCIPELANLTLEEQLQLSVPSGELTGYPNDASCLILDLDYTTLATNYVDNSSYISMNVTDTRKCTQWSYDLDEYGRTAVTEWDLVCDKAAMQSVATSIYMLGFLVGVSLFGYMSDRIGRKVTWMICMTSAAILSIVASFMPEYWSYIIMRMLVGLFLAGSYTVSFVLVMEMIGKEKRVLPGIAYHGWFTVGYMSTAFFAYLIKDYVWLNFTVSILSSVFIGTYWFVPKSARWLLARGRTQEAKCEIRRMGKINKKPEIETLHLYDKLLIDDDKEKPEVEDSKSQKNYNMIDLLRTPRMRSRSLIALFSWFVNAMVFYGISLAVADLAGDPYINMVISGACECVGLIVAIIALDRLGRRWPLCFFMVFGGVSCLLSNVLPDDWRIFATVLAMLGKFGISGSFALVYVYTAEMFPTVVRTIAVGAGSMGALVGGLIAPFINELGRLVWGPFPMIIFGGSALVGGVLSLFLPETLHQKLPESLQEGEDFGKDNKQKFFSWPRKQKNEVVLDAVASDVVV